MSITPKISIREQGLKSSLQNAITPKFLGNKWKQKNEPPQNQLVIDD
jgi:hypothetical protein